MNMNITQADVYEELIELLNKENLEFKIKENGLTNSSYNKTLFHCNAAPICAIYVDISTGMISILPLHYCNIGYDEFEYNLLDPNCFHKIVQKIKELECQMS